MISKVESAKLQGNPTLEQFQMHVTNLLLDWLSISANDANKRPAFIIACCTHFLLTKWERSSIFATGLLTASPTKILGFVTPSNLLNLSSPGLRPSGCRNQPMASWLLWLARAIIANFAQQAICQSELYGGPKSCLSFNPQAKIPASATKAECERVELHRNYLALKPDIKSLKNVKVETMEQMVAAASNGTLIRYLEHLDAKHMETMTEVGARLIIVATAAQGCGNFIRCRLRVAGGSSR